MKNTKSTGYYIDIEDGVMDKLACVEAFLSLGGNDENYACEDGNTTFFFATAEKRTEFSEEIGITLGKV